MLKHFPFEHKFNKIHSKTALFHEKFERLNILEKSWNAKPAININVLFFEDNFPLRWTIKLYY